MARPFSKPLAIVALLGATQAAGAGCERKTINRTPEAMRQLDPADAVPVHERLKETNVPSSAAPSSSGAGRITSMDFARGVVVIAHDARAGDDWPNDQEMLNVSPKALLQGLSVGDLVWFHVETREGLPEIVKQRKLARVGSPEASP